jgi:hypothetical protein
MSIFIIDLSTLSVCFSPASGAFLTRNKNPLESRKEGSICSFCAFPTLIWRKMHLLQTLIRRQQCRHKGICRACTWGIRVESGVSLCKGYWLRREGARIKIIPRGECHFSVFLFCRAGGSWCVIAPRCAAHPVSPKFAKGETGVRARAN